MLRASSALSRTRRTIAVTLVALSAAPAAFAQRGPAKDIEAITKAGAQFSQLYMRGDADGMGKLYTDDAVIFPPGRPMIRGRAGITGYWTLPPNVKVVDHKTTADSIIVVGSTAYDYGTFRSQTARDGQTGNPGTGKYVIVWQKGSDGAWRMRLDIWNPGA